MWPIKDTTPAKVMSGKPTPRFLSHFRTPTPAPALFYNGGCDTHLRPGQSHTLMSVIPQLPKPVTQGISRVTVEHKTVKKEAISVLPSVVYLTFLCCHNQSNHTYETSGKNINNNGLLIYPHIPVLAVLHRSQVS
jgi:hypothetical protein